MKIICDLEGNPTATEFSSEEERTQYQQECKQKEKEKEKAVQEKFNKKREILEKSFEARGLDLTEYCNWLCKRYNEELPFQIYTHNEYIFFDEIRHLTMAHYKDIDEYEDSLREHIDSLKKEIRIPWFTWGRLQERLSFYEEMLDKITPA